MPHSIKAALSIIIACIATLLVASAVYYGLSSTQTPQPTNSNTKEEAQKQIPTLSPTASSTSQQLLRGIVIEIKKKALVLDMQLPAESAGTQTTITYTEETTFITVDTAHNTAPTSITAENIHMGDVLEITTEATDLTQDILALQIIQYL
ncbi:MAG TPA: hypothetical protein VJB65_00985 [Patescibacteria group bacterium]|nr:hypothetical protein [Patescibacteria group bacterium]